MGEGETSTNTWDQNTKLVRLLITKNDQSKIGEINIKLLYVLCSQVEKGNETVKLIFLF